MKLTVAIATRNRSELLAETLRHFVANSVLSETRILVLYDEDDEDTHWISRRTEWNGKVIFSKNVRAPSLGEKYNLAMEVAPADVYQVAVDYAPVLTKGYDELVLMAADAFPDGICCVYGPPANASFPTIQAPTHKLCELMGGIFPPLFPFWFVDHWLDDIMEMTQRISPLWLRIDCHSRATGQTIGLRDVSFWADVFDRLKLQRRAIAHRVIDHLEEPDWRKVILKRNFLRVETYSEFINNQVRANEADIELTRGGNAPTDLWYQKVKERAEKTLALLSQKDAA